MKILSVGLALLNLEPPKHAGQVIPVRRPLKVRPRGAAAWLAVNCGRKGRIQRRETCEARNMNRNSRRENRTYQR